ncbi:MAG: cytochrome c3 family protein [Chloroflexota bacterium]
MGRLVKLFLGGILLGGVLWLDRWLPEPRTVSSVHGIVSRVLVLSGISGSIVVGALMLVIGIPWLLERQHFPLTPAQPIAFSHQVHVQVAGADCTFCHRTAATGDSAGLPDLEQCMFCHLVVDQSLSTPSLTVAIQAVQASWVEQREIEWARLHHIPDHSRFPHSAHLQAGIPCAECHGEVERMLQVQQVRSLKMADCVACHQQTAAPLQCVTCHY